MLVAAHRGRRERLAQEEDGEPAAALPDHVEEPDVEVRCVEGLRAADLLDVASRFLLGVFEHVVDRDDAEHLSLGIHHRERDPVVAIERGDDLVARRRRRDRQGRAWVDLGDAGAVVRENQGPEAQVFDQPSVVVEDV